MTRNYIWILLVLMLVIVFPITGKADSLQNEKDKNDYKWFLSVYGGPRADQTLGDMVTFEAKYSDGNYVMVGALAREVYRYEQLFSVELEGQLGKHFGDDVNHWEAVFAVLWRWQKFPWDDYIDTSFAAGAGLSYYNKISEIEYEEDEDAQRLLGYLAFELTFGLPQYQRWDLMFRIHHRSGARETIGDSGSNYLCVGVKFAF